MEERTRYFKQVETNQSYIRKYVNAVVPKTTSLTCTTDGYHRVLSTRVHGSPSSYVVSRSQMFTVLTGFLGRGAGVFDEQP